MTAVPDAPATMTLTLREVAEQLRVSRAQAYRLADRGVLPTVFVGQRRRVLVRELEAALAEGRLNETTGGTNR